MGVLPNNTWYCPDRLGFNVHDPACPVRASEEPASSPLPGLAKNCDGNAIQVPWLGNSPPTPAASAPGVVNWPKAATAPSRLGFSAALAAARAAGSMAFHAAEYF